MERTSILRLFRSAVVRPQYTTSSTRCLSTLVRNQHGTLRHFSQVRPASLATKRYPAPLYSLYPRLYSTPSAAPTAPYNPPSQTSSEDDKHLPLRDAEGQIIPTYMLTFTCKPCKHRSTHKITKLGYHYGSVLITCPNCKSRHIMSDHLGYFSDKKTNIEEILKEKNEFVKRGSMTDTGEIEFWKDGQPTGEAKENGA